MIPALLFALALGHGTWKENLTAIKLGLRDGLWPTLENEAAVDPPQTQVLVGQARFALARQGVLYAYNEGQDELIIIHSALGDFLDGQVPGRAYGSFESDSFIGKERAARTGIGVEPEMLVSNGFVGSPKIMHEPAINHYLGGGRLPAIGKSNRYWKLYPIFSDFQIPAWATINRYPSPIRSGNGFSRSLQSFSGDGELLLKARLLFGRSRLLLSQGLARENQRPAVSPGAHTGRFISPLGIDHGKDKASQAPQVQDRLPESDLDRVFSGDSAPHGRNRALASGLIGIALALITFGAGFLAHASYRENSRKIVRATRENPSAKTHD